jgi:3-dehydroquinate dehydratase II
MPVKNRIEVMHGVNMNMLGRRAQVHYGTLSLPELELRVDEYGSELGLALRFFQTNSEAEFVDHLHRLEGMADGILLNPGAWTHYSWAIHDALEIAALPAVEVHLSAVNEREQWRRVSVVSDLCLATISGEGVEGYREALVRLGQELDA